MSIAKLTLALVAFLLLIGAFNQRDGPSHPPGGSGTPCTQESLDNLSLQLNQKDAHTSIAEPGRSAGFVTGELLAHVVENLSQLAERTIQCLQDFVRGYEEGRRQSRTTSNPNGPAALQAGAGSESNLESGTEERVEKKNANEESNSRRLMPCRNAR